MNLNLKNKLYNSVKTIQDSDIRKFTYDALDNAPEQFWTDPCSSSGKNHPPEDQGEGGIVRHLLKGTYVCSELGRFFSIPEKEKDVSLAGWILHDIKKNGNPWTSKTNYEHGLIGYKWLGQFELKNPEKEKIRNCVRYHMWQWAQPEEEAKRAVNPEPWEGIVQLTDYICSRKGVSFLPGIELTKKQIENYSR